MQPVSGVSLTMPPLVIDIGKTKRGPMATASETDVRILDVFFLPPIAIGRLGITRRRSNVTHGMNPTIAGAAPHCHHPRCKPGCHRGWLAASLCARSSPLSRWRNLPPCRSFSGTVGACPGARHAARTAGHTRSATSCQRLTGNLAYTVTAANRKAERRCSDPACGFAANLRVVGNDHTRHRLLASSPNQPGGQPLVFADRPIPLGFSR